MADELEDGIWPLPRFYFRVRFSDSLEATFQEVSGLDNNQEIKYRSGDGRNFQSIKMPGIVKYGNVSLKKGLFKGGQNSWEWLSRIKTNTVERQSVTILLVDESGSPTMTWTLKNAFPVKVMGVDMHADSGVEEIRVDGVEMAHEGIEVKNM
ncbi:MAG: phage tail protein [Bacteroides sp.]|jgi:phage tail-like protein|nr:phage tail protein [Bacteroides sp.]MCI1683325.1 phage tail protein [Bacteroides sp.]